MYDSANRMLFWPEGIDKNITNKTSMKPFSDLEDPIVVAMPLFENHNFLGVHAWGSKLWQVGNVLVVYDWKTDSIYDWAFTTGSCGWNDYQMVPINGSWWISGLDGNATKLDPQTGNISIYHHGIVSQIVSETAPEKSFLLSPDGRYDSDIIITKTYYRFNTETGTIDCEPYSIKGAEENYYPKGDAEGNFWRCSRDKKNGNKKYLHKLTPSGADIKIEIPENFSEDFGHDYSIRFTDDSSVIIYASRNGDTNPEYPRAYKYNKNLSQFNLISLPVSENDKYNMCEGIMVNDELYFIFMNSEIGKDLRIGKYEPENQKIEFTDEILKYNFTGWPYKCGSRIYLLSWWNTQELKYEWYDVETKEFSDPKIIGLKEILEIQ